MLDTSRNVSVLSDLPTNVSAEALQAVASYFGIYESVDGNGDKKWTIRTQHNQSAGLQQGVTFEPSTRTWRLHERYFATDKMRQPSDNIPRGHPHRTNDDPGGDGSSEPTTPFAGDNWTYLLPQIPHTHLFRSVDWSKTPLGPLDSWPKSLRYYTHMVLCQRTPAVLYWGDHHVAIYNEHLIPLIGQLHPKFLGAQFFVVWKELKASFSAIFEQLKTTGMGIDLTDYNLFLERSNYVEETWWKGNLVPLVQEDGSVGGSYFLWNEITRQVLYDRRTRLLNDLGQYDSTSPDRVWEHIRKCLSHHPRDIAMAILYSAQDNSEGQDNKLRSRGAIGIGTNHTAAPEVLDLQSDIGFAPAMRKALESPHGWIAIERTTEHFPKAVLEGVDWQGYGEKSRSIIIIPLVIVNKLLRGFIVLGLNPRRAFDADHRQFVADMQRQLVTIMNSVTTAEQAVAREARLTRELAESERRTRQIVELAPIGMYELSADGHLNWANRHYFAIMTGDESRADTSGDFGWQDLVVDGDLSKLNTSYEACLADGVEISDTVRLKRKWRPPHSITGGDEVDEEHVHVFYQAFSHEDENQPTSLIGCLTDVSRFIWAESVQAKSAEMARQARQRQEDFIDIISHELRNPLSAVTQCADGIIQSIQEIQTPGASSNVDQILKSNLEAAESIFLCAGHQRRIVDDVLTLSKLDSDLITISPRETRAENIQRETMQMFQAEFAANQMSVSVDSSSTDVAVHEQIYCDPTRISQILVNFVTNAIKFTRRETPRRLTVKYGLTKTPPMASNFGSHFQWSNSNSQKKLGALPDAAYATGPPVYLFFSVRDDGQGINRDSAVKIFDKFIQASRRTHVKYGGSGLGLYISRELAEMQGGHIGVESEEGVGSNFAFYVKVAQVASAGSSLPLTQNIPSTIVTQASVDKDKIEVLLVEDNLVNQKILVKQLAKAGVTVHVANHGGEAIDFVLRTFGDDSYNYMTHSEAPGALRPTPKQLDCILMDWEMPVVDGLQATKRIRKFEDEQLIKVRQTIIGVTANARPEQIKAALDVGMDAVVTKPFRVSDLMAKIHDIMLQRTTPSTAEATAA